MAHKENCEWVDAYFSMYYNNPNGDDERLIITETELEFDEHVFSSKKPAKSIHFNFCPVCGCSLNESD